MLDQFFDSFFEKDHYLDVLDPGKVQLKSIKLNQSSTQFTFCDLSDNCTGLDDMTLMAKMIVLTWNIPTGHKHMF